MKYIVARFAFKVNLKTVLSCTSIFFKKFADITATNKLKVLTPRSV